MFKISYAYKGLNGKHRIDTKLKENKDCVSLARRGFSLKLIRKYTGLTYGQIIYRCRKKNFNLSDFRNGVGTAAESILSNYSVVEDVEITKHGLKPRRASQRALAV